VVLKRKSVSRKKFMELEVGEGNTYSKLVYSCFLNAYFAIVVTPLAFKVLVFTSIVHAPLLLDKQLGMKLNIVFSSQLQATSFG
jgi:hypothetical protein